MRNTNNHGLRTLNPFNCWKLSTETISSEASLRGTFNDYPKGVGPSGSKWGTLKRDEDIV